MRSKKKRAVSLFLASVLALSAAGCSQTAQGAQTSENGRMEAGTQASGNGEAKASDKGKSAKKEMTPWINSNVAGTVTESTKADLKDDFNLAVNYDYLKDKKIGEGRKRETCTSELQDITNEQLLKMMTDDTIKGHDAELIQELYAMWLDWDKRNSVGMSELMPHIEVIQKLENLADLTEYLSSEEGISYGAGLSGAILMPDLEDAQWYCLYIEGTPLSLGDSDEYEKRTSLGERNLKAHRETAGLLLKMAGYGEKEIEKLLEQEYAFEKEIASVIMSTAEQQAPDAMQRILNRVTVEQLEEMSPNYPVVKITEALGLIGSDRIILQEPEWLLKMNELYKEENFEKLKSYLLVHTLTRYGKNLDEETFRKLKKIENEVSGITGSEPDEKLALDTVSKALTISVSKVYSQKYVGPEVREDVTNIIKECIGAYRTMLSSEDWLSEETRKKAVEKLDNITVNAAYPDKWQDTKGLQFTPRKDGGSYFTACIELNKCNRELDKKKVNTKIDREAWANDMALTTANAYYNPLDNSINIIAGILGGAFYRPDMTYEEKLAGIGSVIGHEISHAFDPNGAQFDKDGNFSKWWTDEDYAAFEARAQKLIGYYNTIVPFEDGENYPGENVQGEAIADIAGVKCMLILAKERADFDYDLFFRAYTISWRSVCTREYGEYIVYQDVHPMNYLRVNVTLMQQPEFYETYGIEEGDGMYMAKEDRISVW